MKETGPSPFVGLRPFEPDDVPLFFGREETLQRLLNRVRNQRLVILFGPSGSGKTSLLRAGLLPQLSASQQAPNVTVLARVEDDPFLGLARALFGSNLRSASEEESLAEVMRATPQSLSDCLQQAGYPSERTLLVVDQYEEALFRLSATRRMNFEQTVTRAADESGLRALFVLRSDYLGPAVSDGPLSELGPSSLVSLNPLTIEEARTIIQRPAQLHGVDIELPVVEAILSDLRHDLQPHLLQLVMYQLWNARRGDRITLADYRALGGVTRLTSRIYEEPAVRSRWSLSRLASTVGLDALSRTLDERVHLLEQTRADYERVEAELASVVSRREALARKMNEMLSDEEADAPKIFISYAREDEEQAKALYSQLRRLGFSPWIDQEDIPAGREWAPEIKAAMHASDFVVLCLSTKSVSKRGFVQRELRTALDLYEDIPEGRVFLLPVRLEACPVPTQLSRFQYTDLFETGGIDKLVRSILGEWALQLRANEQEGGV